MDLVLNVPNLLSLLSAPFLLVPASVGNRVLFLLCLAAALASNAIDGWLARRLGQTSEFGSRLDSWGDLALSLCAPVGVWWLWPELVRQEVIFFAIILVGYSAPTIFAILKYHRIPSYHTRIAKIAAVLMGPSVLILLCGGSPWFFRLAALVVALEALEEVAITAILPPMAGKCAHPLAGPPTSPIATARVSAGSLLDTSGLTFISIHFTLE